MTQTVAALNGYGGDEPQVAERTFHAGKGHTSSLLLSVEAVLDESGIGIRDVDLIVVGLGPGSFTGLRIGVSAAKALAFATQTDIVGVDSLAALADGVALAEPPEGAIVVTATDARKREVYAAAWRLGEAAPEALVAPNTFSPAALWERLASLEGPLVLTGNGFDVYRESFDNAFGARSTQLEEPFWWPRATRVARLGALRYAAVGATPVNELEPHYIRPSQAEESWARRQKKDEV